MIKLRDLTFKALPFTLLHHQLLTVKCEGMHRVFLTLLAFGALHVPCAQAQTQPDLKPVASERLLMPLFPSGWKEVYRSRESIEVVEYVPTDQSATSWQDKIQLQVYNNLNDLPLDAIQRRTQGQNRNRCTGVVEGSLQSGLNNGYPSAFWTLGCRYIKSGEGKGSGETQYTKAIQGQSSLYVLSRIWRTPAFAQNGPEIAIESVNDGVAFLTTSIVCVPKSEDHPCEFESN